MTDFLYRLRDAALVVAVEGGGAHDPSTYAMGSHMKFNTWENGETFFASLSVVSCQLLWMAWVAHDDAWLFRFGCAAVLSVIFSTFWTLSFLLVKETHA